jgi:hypothetical protein
VSNSSRKRSEYVCNISGDHLEALIEIASRKDEGIEQVILEALDQYIENEEGNHAGKTN